MKIVLLTAKFESPVVVRRKLQVEFGKNRPTEAFIKRTFVRFCEIGTGEDREHHPKVQNKRSTKFVMSFKINHNQVSVPLHQLVAFRRQQHIE